MLRAMIVIIDLASSRDNAAPIVRETKGLFSRLGECLDKGTGEYLAALPRYSSPLASGL